MAEKRTNVAKVGLTDDELEKVEQLATEGGFKTKAALFRFAVLHAYGSDAALADEIGKLGLAINGLSGRVSAARMERLVEAVCRLTETIAERQEAS